MPVGGYFQKAFGFVVGSGLVVPSTSGGIALASSQSSVSVILSTAPAAARMFIGGASAPPVGSGSTDAQRVGFPIGVSGQFAEPFRINISNPSLLAVSAETSGQILFVGIETP